MSAQGRWHLRLNEFFRMKTFSLLYPTRIKSPAGLRGLHRGIYHAYPEVRAIVNALPLNAFCLSDFPLDTRAIRPLGPISVMGPEVIQKLLGAFAGL
jgi:hypothetical protein